MGYAFTNPVDIANRALQHCGVRRISTLTDQSLAAIEINACYDRLRIAELQRNVWTFATRRVALRALDTSAQLLTPSTWAAGTFGAGQIVQYPASSGQYWIATQSTTATPGTYNAAAIATQLGWDQYFGPLSLDLWNLNAPTPVSTATNVSYHIGELAYKTPGDNTYTIYSSIVEGNTQQPDAVDAWVSTTNYNSGQVVSAGGTNYQSRVNLNLNFPPATSATQWTSTVTNPTVSNSWITVAGTIGTVPIIYPITAGPYSVSTTRNAYRLPAGFLKPAPQAPKAGAYTWLGASSHLPADDWEFTDKFIVTAPQTTSVLLVRFVADVQDVVSFDTMFCEGLAVRIALEVAPRLTENPVRERTLTLAYNKFMGEARTANAIEQGPVEPYEDSWLTCRW